jgi:hypothetical protein
MSTAVAVLGYYEPDRWNADVYGALALASRLSGLVKSRALTVQLAYNLWRLNSILRDFFSEIRKAVEHGVPKDQPPVTPERMRDIVQDLRKLHKTIGKIYSACKLTGLTNNSLTAGPLHSIYNYNEDILELAQMLELSQQPETIQSIYDRADVEKERGDIYDVSEIE